MAEADAAADPGTPSFLVRLLALINHGLPGAAGSPAMAPLGGDTVAGEPTNPYATGLLGAVLAAEQPTARSAPDATRGLLDQPAASAGPLAARSEPAPAPLPGPATAAPPAAAPSDPLMTAREAMGNVPAALSDGARLPADSTPTIGGTPVAAAAQGVEDRGFSGGLSDWINHHRMQLAALGTAMAGAQNFGQGINRAQATILPAIQADGKQQQQNQTVAALVRRGLPEGIAVSVAANPRIMLALLPRIFGARQLKFTQIGEDALGNKRFGFVDPVRGEVFDESGNPVSATIGAAAPTSAK